MADRIERLKWWVAAKVLDWAPRQCWSHLVDWVLNDEPISDVGLRGSLPWRPIGESCRRDAERIGRCYCGRLAADGSVLGRGETVPTPDPAALSCAGCPHALPVHPPDGPCAGSNTSWSSFPSTPCPCLGWSPEVDRG